MMLSASFPFSGRYILKTFFTVYRRVTSLYVCNRSPLKWIGKLIILSWSSGLTFCKVSCLLSSVADWFDIGIDLCLIGFFFYSLRISYFISLRTFTLFLTSYVNFTSIAHFSLHFIELHFSYIFYMVYNFPTNADFDSWVLSSKPRTVKQYVDWISEYAEYCLKEGLNIHDGQSVYFFWCADMKLRKLLRDPIRGRRLRRAKILNRRLASCTAFFQR
jgi:hypothetical protein